MDEHEQYLRLAADFDNYRKRMEAELGEVAKFGARLVILDMLDVLDHLEQAIAHAPPDTPSDWFHGLQQVQQQFETSIQKTGAQRIIVQDKTFDPATMEAVSMTDGGPSHQVKEEIRAGYTMHERVIRPARVIIYQ